MKPSPKPINAQIPHRELAPKETFIEVIERRKTPDMAACLAIGANIADQTDSWRSLYRVRYEKTGVQWEFLACAHVRLVCFEETENGERIGVFAGGGGAAIRSGFGSRRKTSRTRERLIGLLVSPVAPALSSSPVRYGGHCGLSFNCEESRCRIELAELVLQVQFI